MCLNCFDYVKVLIVFAFRIRSIGVYGTQGMVYAAS